MRLIRVLVQSTYITVLYIDTKNYFTCEFPFGVLNFVFDLHRDSERLSEVADLRNQLQARDESIRNLEQQSERLSVDNQQHKENLQTLTSENETLKSSNESQCKVQYCYSSLPVYVKYCTVFL